LTPSKPEINRLLVSKDGRVLNSNQAEVNFKLVEEDNTIILTVKLPKYENDQKPLHREFTASFFLKPGTWIRH
jgi:hypothetical protein